ncbi:ABC transporter permease [Fulvivirga lutimaris]|uniref:ABC transporter permease n=1 Tax=Fulvivirga lutimaris TaxID=1819566 RepID=UPI0012BD5D92|nr:ABC transporter permease [Fulvivirga lutimaris]MTI39041.1 ABC transporter permease [Fulvivirga lutimaris]
MKPDTPIDPPRWPFILLGSFMNPLLLDEVEGDLYETFDKRVEEVGAKKAKWLLIRDVLSMFRPFAIKKITNKNSINTLTMISSYFKLTIRGIKSNLMSSLISIFGLSIAVACCIVLFLFGMNIITANDFIADADRIYMVTSHTKNVNNDPFIWGKTPEMMGTTASQDYNGIDGMTRVLNGNAVVRYGSIVLEEPIQYVDEDFLKIFNFELTDGTSASLYDGTKVVLSAKAAEKFFGKSYALDEELSLIINGETIPVTVGAIAAPFPTNSYFSFNILVPYKLASTSTSDWDKLTNATFFKVKNASAIDNIKDLSGQYWQAYNSKSPKYPISQFEFIPFSQLTKTDYQIVGSVVGRENPSTLIGIIFFGLLLIFIACFNYVNIAIVTATRRLKEIGLRKSVGASKKQLVFQFLSQNVFMCLFAVIAGLIVAHVILVPLFNSFFPFELSITYTNPTLWIFLLSIAMSTGILSGIYPAFYVSSFSATNIFQGKEKFGSSKNYLFKFFLGIQFAFTFLIIFSGISFISNSSFQKAKDWGYNQGGLVVIPTTTNDQFTALFNRLSTYPEISSVSGSANHIGNSTSVMDIDILDEKKPVVVYNVDSSYLRTMGIKLVEGRNLNSALASDVENGLIVNRKFANTFMIGDVPGSQIKSKGEQYNIIGVVEDFHYRNFYFPIDAMAFKLSTPEQNNFIIAKVDAGNLTQVNEKIKADWGNMFPDYPYNGYFQNEAFDEFFRQMSIPTNILITFSVISIILSAMGLFGLVSLIITKRMKEISIRKVLGASMKEIALLTNVPFIVVLGIALIVAIPTSQYLIKLYLDQVNAFHVPIDFTITVPSILILLITVLLTISSNLFKVSKSSPVEALAEK